jgi:hypothetical protein
MGDKSYVIVEIHNDLIAWAGEGGQAAGLSSASCRARATRRAPMGTLPPRLAPLLQFTLWMACQSLPSFLLLRVSSATDKVIFLRWLHTVLLWLRLTMPFIFRTLGLLFFS